ncbi:MAG: EamA family transporter [Bacteroidetes bacterium]|nr:MAG: EamA family transporter [Bacteroidota bacterium]
MISSHYGEFAALLTALFWTITALAFEKATKTVGSIAVNIIRLVLGFLFLGLLTYVQRGMFLPLDATQYAWFWLMLSGFVGLMIGDLFLFASYPIIGARIAMLMMTLAPPLAAILGLLILDEKMSSNSIIGMLLVMAGIAMVIWSRPESNKKMKLNFPIKGLIFAFMGAVGQAGGLVLSKLGMQDYDPFAATQIRIIAAMFGFIILISIMGRWKNVLNALKNRNAITNISIGSFFGPFLGVSFSLVAIKYTSTGIASTLMSIVPVLIILPSVVIFKQKVSIKEIIGAVISVIGVSLFFI